MRSLKNMVFVCLIVMFSSTLYSQALRIDYIPSPSRIVHNPFVQFVQLDSIQVNDTTYIYFVEANDLFGPYTGISSFYYMMPDNVMYTYDNGIGLVANTVLGSGNQFGGTTTLINPYELEDIEYDIDTTYSHFRNITASIEYFINCDVYGTIDEDKNIFESIDSIMFDTIFASDHINDTIALHFMRQDSTIVEDSTIIVYEYEYKGTHYFAIVLDSNDVIYGVKNCFTSGFQTQIKSSTDKINTEYCATLVPGYSNIYNSTFTWIGSGNYSTVGDIRDTLLTTSCWIGNGNTMTISRGSYNWLGNGHDNYLSGQENCFIASGYQNSIFDSSYYCSVINGSKCIIYGVDNTAFWFETSDHSISEYSTIINGHSNMLSASDYSTVLAGYETYINSSIFTLIFGRNIHINTNDTMSIILGRNITTTQCKDILVLGDSVTLTGKNSYAYFAYDSVNVRGSLKADNIIFQANRHFSATSTIDTILVLGINQNSTVVVTPHFDGTWTQLLSAKCITDTIFVKCAEADTISATTYGYHYIGVK